MKNLESSQLEERLKNLEAQCASKASEISSLLSQIEEGKLREGRLKPKKRR